MAYRLIVNGEQVSYTSYKPNVGDLIRNDKTGKWYQVEKVEGHKSYCKETYERY